MKRLFFGVEVAFRSATGGGGHFRTGRMRAWKATHDGAPFTRPTRLLCILGQSPEDSATASCARTVGLNGSRSSAHVDQTPAPTPSLKGVNTHETYGSERPSIFSAIGTANGSTRHSSRPFAETRAISGDWLGDRIARLLTKSNNFKELTGNLVGVRGFEPPTPCSRSRCATRLRYTPTDGPAYR